MREELEAGSFDGRFLRMRIFPHAHGAGVLFSNMTEQQLLRRRLEHAEALDAAVRRHPHAASIRLDTRARVEAIDEVFCARSGFSAADVIGHRFIDLIAAPQRREAGELIERVLREAASQTLALVLLGKRGQEMPGSLSLAPISTDFVAHGAQALWVPSDHTGEERQAA